MNNVIPFRPRTSSIAPPVPLYRFSVTLAKALGICPDAANDTGARGARSTGDEVRTADGGGAEDGLASLLELSIRAAVEARTGSR